MSFGWQKSLFCTVRPILNFRLGYCLTMCNFSLSVSAWNINITNGTSSVLPTYIMYSTHRLIFHKNNDTNDIFIISMRIVILYIHNALLLCYQFPYEHLQDGNLLFLIYFETHKNKIFIQEWFIEGVVFMYYFPSKFRYIQLNK